MVRRSWVALLLVVLVAAMGLLAGCVESSDEEARTPSDAPTVANSALQTDSEGNTVTAPAATAPAATAPAEGGADTTGGGEEPTGDVAAGQQFFATTCTGCHMNNGMDAGGVGPKLAGLGVDLETVKTTVENGRGAMPPGLASGTDLENVAAYVVSIQ